MKFTMAIDGVDYGEMEAESVVVVHDRVVEERSIPVANYKWTAELKTTPGAWGNLMDWVCGRPMKGTRKSRRAERVARARHLGWHGRWTQAGKSQDRWELWQRKQNDWRAPSPFGMR